VVVCTGQARNLNFPPALQNGVFKGQVVHSTEYIGLGKQHFANKRVLVVGLGETASDIIGDVHDVVKELHVRLDVFCCLFVFY
jgi:cation diffusion facilitator CzcD-associated flavoprotein CzcO